MKLGVACALVALINVGDPGDPPDPPKYTVLEVKGDTLTAETLPLFKFVMATEVSVLPVCALDHRENVLAA